MKKIKYIVLVFAIILGSCDYGDLNDNPNEPTNVPEILLLNGTMLADIAINASHLQRISGMWTSQYRGEQPSYESLYNYGFSGGESNSAWEFLYNGIINQNKIIRSAFNDDNLIQGITKVVEANALGSAAAIWGDIPYSEAVGDIEDPIFDAQVNIYASLQILLDDAISNLNATDGYPLSQDIFFNGDESKWIQVAYSLKARYYMITKEYGLALQAAQNGVNSNSSSLKFYPPATTNGDSNLIYEFTSGARSGYLHSDDTYLEDLIATGSFTSRNNSKTNEDARSKYYVIDTDGSEIGVGAPGAPMPLMTYEENLLTLAEAAARTSTFDEALGYLNELRVFLASGNAFEKIDNSDVLLYDAYDEADFADGGIENADGINDTRALLREIVEERYVSGYGTFTPWNDARRLRKTDSDISVPFPLNTSSVSTHPERFIISQNELNSNSNAPTGLTIFDVTEVNQ